MHTKTRTIFIAITSSYSYYIRKQKHRKLIIYHLHTQKQQIGIQSAG